MPRKILFAWDFDRTIVLENTDTYVLDIVSPEHLTILRSTPGEWRERLNTVLAQVNAAGHTSSAIISALKLSTLPESTSRAIDQIAKSGIHQSAILSDANDIYINTILNHHGLPIETHFRAGLFTNTATITDSDAIRIITRHEAPDPPGCERCKHSICKGSILERLAENFDNVVYIGDGGNDLCPSLRVQSGGIVMPRVGFLLERKLVEPENVELLKASVQPWKEPPDLESAISHAIAEAAEGEVEAQAEERE